MRRAVARAAKALASHTSVAMSGADAAPLQSARPSSSSSSSSSTPASSSSRKRGREVDGAAVADASAAPSLPLTFEERQWSRGHAVVAGVDEAGRGPLAGPVVAAAVALLEPGVRVPGVDDSKKIDEAQRDAAYARLTTDPRIAWAVAVVDHETIDHINILQAALRAMTEAMDALSVRPSFVYIDGNRMPPAFKARLAERRTVPVDPKRAAIMAAGGADGGRASSTTSMPFTAETVVGGDGKVFSIAAASIIAKVHRDRLMRALDEAYPNYGLAQHKGYPTPAHVAALARFGPSPIHRLTFAPLKGKFERAAVHAKWGVAPPVVFEEEEEEDDEGKEAGETERKVGKERGAGARKAAGTKGKFKAATTTLKKATVEKAEGASAGEPTKGAEKTETAAGGGGRPVRGGGGGGKSSGVEASETPSKRARSRGV